MNPAWLVHIQVHLGEDLSLTALSAMAGLSPGHFQRTFRAYVGETPKAYVARLRLEQAAFRLLIHETTILDVALEAGFQNHETFTRAFQRRFGMAPRRYRDWVRAQAQAADGDHIPSSEADYAVSDTKVRRLSPAHLAFIRHVGPYEAVPDTLFDTLENWANQQGLTGPRIWMGLGHDAPGATRAEHLRFDAALAVPRAFAATGAIGYQWFAGGEFAVTTHAGPYDTLPSAYAAMLPRVMQLPNYRLVGLPAVEIYQTARVNARLQLNVTDICLPIMPKSRSLSAAR